MRLLPVPRHPDGGPDLAVMQRLAEAHHPAPTSPSRCCMQPHRQQPHCRPGPPSSKLADQHDLLIVEDDTYAFLAPEHTVRLSALDGLKRTIYVPGLSKFLSPAWRVGYLAASPERTQRLIDPAAPATSPAMPCPNAVAHVLDQGQLRATPSAMQQRLDAARTRSVALAERAGARFVSRRAASSAGSTWAWTPNAWPSPARRRLADRPGVLFSATRQPGSLMRINFATAQTCRLLARPATAWRHSVAADAAQPCRHF